MDYNSTYTGAQIDAAVAKIGGVEAGADITDTEKVIAAGAAMKNETTGIIIPLYIYPSDAYTNAVYNSIIDLKKQYHNVPLYVILNPESGPGSVVDGNYTAVIQRLTGAGAIVLGYVSTSYGAELLADVKADIDGWQTLYPETKGIFFDEATNTDTQENIDYYLELNTYAKEAGFSMVVGNPGSAVPYSYYTNNLFDLVIVYETTDYPTEAFLKGDFDEGHADTSYKYRAAIAYDTEFDANEIKMMQKYLGAVYITDDALPNPWDVVSTFLEDIFVVLAGKNNSILFYEEETTTSREITSSDSGKVIFTSNSEATILQLNAGNGFTANSARFEIMAYGAGGIILQPDQTVLINGTHEDRYIDQGCSGLVKCIGTDEFIFISRGFNYSEYIAPEAIRSTADAIVLQSATPFETPDADTLLTFSAGSSTKTITNPVIIDRNDSKLNYYGGIVEQFGPSYPKTLFNKVANLTYVDKTRGSSAAVVSFNATFQEIEIYVLGNGANSLFRVVADGEAVAYGPTIPLDGSLKYYKLDFGSSATRDIRIEGFYEMAFGEIVLNEGAVLNTQTPETRRFVTIGDSITEGATVDNKHQSIWASIVPKHFGFKNYSISGFGSTGWLKTMYPGYGATRDTIAGRWTEDIIDFSPDIIVAAGGYNDTNDYTAEAFFDSVNNSILETRDSLPNAIIFLVAPWNVYAPTPRSGTYATIATDMEYIASLHKNVIFLDPDLIAYTRSDGTHPDEAGHITLANWLISEITTNLKILETTDAKLSRLDA